MKRLALIFTVLALVLCMALSLAACNNSETPDNGGNEQGGENNNNGSSGNNGDNGGNDEDDGMETYTVLVKDTNGSPVSGVAIQLCSDAGCQLPMNTNSDGIVTFELFRDDYKAQISSLPAGYTVESLADKYTMLNNAAVITVSTSASYIVSVKDQYGDAVSGAVVTHTGAAESLTTDATGVAVFACPPKAGYKVFVSAPEGYEKSAVLYTYSGEEKSVEVVLSKVSKISVIVEDFNTDERMADVIVALYDSKTGELVSSYVATGTNGVAVFYVVGDSKTSYVANVKYLDGYTSVEAAVVDGYATVTVTEVTE
ncbi:MAG: hypothetical protein IKD45_05065 [Clostridia bacterium]|nr:hypothetical protein [Clostridia bacterium]